MMENFKNDIEGSLSALKTGGIILYPTDTIWGIGCDATNMQAIRCIFQLKQRDEKKSMILLINGLEMVHHYAEQPSTTLLDIMKNATTPTTIIFDKGKNLPPSLINVDGSIALRWVQDAFCRQLIAQLGKPLVSTSANISGEKPPKNFIEITNEIKEQVDYIVHYRQNDTEEKSPSSIIWLNEKGEAERIRG